MQIKIKLWLALRNVMPVNITNIDGRSVKTNSIEYKRNPWQYIKKFTKCDHIRPTFNSVSCAAFFKNLLTARFSTRTFNKPNWMVDLPAPSVPFNHDLQCPSYRDVTNAIKRMKTGACPCPLDGISVIVFKRCLALKTFLTKLITGNKKHFLTPGVEVSLN